MAEPTRVPPEPPVWVIEHSPGWGSLNLRELWAYRELLYFLVWRDVKVRYRQTALGVAWVVLQPVLSLLVFSVLFGRLLKVPTEGSPYPVFVFAALLPWNFFAGALARCTASLVASSHLITKVYFPRLVVPLSAVLAALVDFAVSFAVLIALLLFYDVKLGTRALVVPGLVVWTVLVALAFGLWLAALNVGYRDVGHIVPVLLQVWIYFTPVIYGSGLIPEPFRSLLWLNPMTGVAEAFRWALLGVSNAPLALSPLARSVPLVSALLVGGLLYFRATERGFADTV